jgi:hypothetical protein
MTSIIGRVRNRDPQYGSCSRQLLNLAFGPVAEALDPRMRCRLKMVSGESGTHCAQGSGVV